MFNFIQTFFVDKAAVANAATVLISGVDLFVRAKPNNQHNSSGINNPGITVSLCEVDNGVPVPTKEFSSFSRVKYDQVFPLDDASIATPFGFDRPILVKTDAYYGIVVRLDDSNYQLWTNKSGDAILGTNDPSPGATSSRDGSLFQGANDGSIKIVDGTDLKFRVRVAKFGATTDLFEFVNGDYEFLTINTRSGFFTGGENVFANTAPITGTANFTAGNTTVIGSGTDFTTLARGQKIVLKSNTTHFIGQIDQIANTTVMDLVTGPAFSNTAGTILPGVIGVLSDADYVSNRLTLSDSTAKSTLKFAAGQLLTGERSGTTAILESVNNINVDEFTSHIDLITQSATTAAPTYALGLNAAGVYSIDATYASLVNGKQKPITAGRHVILSKSNEVAVPALYGDVDKSAVVKVNVTTSNSFVAPVIDALEADITVSEFVISPVGSGIENGLDTEIFANGNQKAKHITNKITFDGNRDAESLRVFATVYRPPGTDILIYAKLQASTDHEPFDDKLWTPLVIKNNASGLFSSSTNRRNFIEFEYGLPSYPEVSRTLATNFTGAEGNATLTAAATGALGGADIVVGALVRVYDSFFPTNQFVARISSFTATTIVLDQALPTGLGLGNAGLKVDLLKYSTAFDNTSNFNIVRYFTTSGAVHDRFSVAQIKVVLQANSTDLVPEVDQLEAIGVSG